MVGEINISSLCFADDIMLKTDSPKKLQKLINDLKLISVVMTLNLQMPKESFYLLGKGKEVKFVSDYKYLGVTSQIKDKLD